MSARPVTWQRAGYQAWNATYSGTGPFEHWLNGKLIDVITATSRLYEDADYVDRPPAIEVIDTDTADAAQGASYPPYAVLHWWSDPDVFYYFNIYLGGVLFSTKREHGNGYHRWEATAVGVPTTEEYTVTGVDLDEAESEALPITVLVRGVPGQVTKSLAYADPNATITASVA